MAWNKNILVLANVTATSDELVHAIRARASQEQVAHHVIAEPKPELKTASASTHARSALGPLTALGWGSPHHGEG